MEAPVSLVGFRFACKGSYSHDLCHGDIPSCFFSYHIIGHFSLHDKSADDNTNGSLIREVDKSLKCMSGNGKIDISMVMF